MRARHQLEVLALEIGLEVAHRRRAAPAVAHVELHDAHPVDALAVEVRVARMLQAGARFHEGLGVRGGLLDVGDGHGTALAAPGVGAAHVVLHALEVGQYVLVAPAGGARRFPAVVVAGRAAQEHQAVDRARAAQHLAARPAQAPAVEMRLGLGLVAPVDGRGWAPACRSPGEYGSRGCGRARRPRSGTARWPGSPSGASPSRNPPSLRPPPPRRTRHRTSCGHPSRPGRGCHVCASECSPMSFDTGPRPRAQDEDGLGRSSLCRPYNPLALSAGRRPVSKGTPRLRG